MTRTASAGAEQRKRACGSLATGNLRRMAKLSLAGLGTFLYFTTPSADSVVHMV
jgi:hypothetical protein